MSWAKAAIETLHRGEQATLRHEGDAMQGRVDDGANVILAPIVPGDLKVGDVVLARVKGEDYLHLIRAIDRGTFFVGDNVGGVGGWIEKDALHGVMIEAED